MSWITDLDQLAIAGVLDFDAAAYVNGTAPRYTGNPQAIPFAPDLPKDTSFLEPPTVDEFIPSEFNGENKNDPTIVKNKPWKKWAFAGTILAGIAYVGCRIAGVKIPMPKALSGLGTKISNGFKTLISKFRRTPPTPSP